MRCKQGDLAVVVLGQDEGRFVRCLSRYDGPWMDQGHIKMYEPGWQVEWQGPPSDFNQIADFALRPIRDPGDDAQDETLTWKDVPQKVEA